MPVIYDSRRLIYINRIAFAKKDNKVVKKGESYIWVKRTKYSPIEYFRNEKELDKVYPEYFRLSKKDVYDIIIKSPLAPKNIKTYLNQILK